MGCGDPVGEHLVVQVPPDERLASRSVAHSTCQPRNGRTQRESARRPAASLRPEICRVVVHRIVLTPACGTADGLQWPEGSSPGYAKASVQDTPGV